MIFVRLLIIVAVVCSGFVFESFGQTSKLLVDFRPALADQPIERTRYRFPDVTAFLRDVALEDEVPIILEVSTADRSQAVAINFKGGPLSDLLDQFTDWNPYRWEIVNGVAHVYPTESREHIFSSELLKRRTAKIHLKENTSVSSFLRELLKSPDVKDLEESTGMKQRGLTLGGFYLPMLGKHYSQEIKEGTVMDALGEVIKRSPTTRIWILRTVDSDRLYYINFGCRYETDDMQNKTGNEL